jgi:hypothetical protein
MRSVRLRTGPGVKPRRKHLDDDLVVAVGDRVEEV